MRSHGKIIKDYGAARLARDLVGLGVVLHPSTPQRWAQRNSIPGEYWLALSRLGASSIEDLAVAAAAHFPHHAAPGSPCKALAGGVMPEPGELVRRSTIATTVNLNSIQPDAE